MEKEELLQMLNAHSSGMKDLSLSIAIIEGNKINKYYYDGKHVTEEIPQFIYEIGSVTKTFTAALLMKMVSEGKIKLNDTIENFIPEIMWDQDMPVPTILQLVTHTSGIGNDIDCSSEEAGMKLEQKLKKFTGDFENDCIYGYLDEEDYIETLRTVKWMEVGHEFQYSNIGITILGIVLQRLIGVPYEKLMEKFIKEELGLYHTWLDIPKDIPNGYNLVAPFGLDQTEKNHWIWNRKIGMAAGGIYSTLDDMITYIKAHLDCAPMYLKDGYMSQLAYSEANNFGIAVTWIKEGEITWHNGATGCFHSFVGLNKNKKKAVVILENHHEINSMSIDDIGKSLLTNN